MKITTILLNKSPQQGWPHLMA